MVKFNAFEFFGSFRFTMQQCELDIDNFLSGGSNFPHKKSFIKLPLAAQQHLEGNGKMLKWTEGGDISCSLQGHKKILILADEVVLLEGDFELFLEGPKNMHYIYLW